MGLNTENIQIQINFKHTYEHIDLNFCRNKYIALDVPAANEDISGGNQ